jgi:anti-anti-sigma factor
MLGRPNADAPYPAGIRAGQATRIFYRSARIVIVSGWTAFASLQTSVALLAMDPDFWSVMRVEHKPQPAGGRAASATGSEACSGFPALPRLFAAAVQLDADRAVVMLRGELDLMSVTVLVDCFAGIAPPIHEVVLDFAELDFIECAGLHAIATATQAAVAHGGSLSIRSPRPQLKRLLNLVNFEQIVANHS